jgi:pilus assembly protein CpaB
MFGVAVVCGLAASVMASYVIKGNTAEVTILVAKEKMQQWEVIKDPDLKFAEKQIRVQDAPKDVFTADKKNELKDRQLKRNIDEGEPLTAVDLQPKDKSSIESTLTPGKRAWSISVTPDSVAGGFVLPGSHVDVWHMAREGNRSIEATMVLENVLVRGVGQQPVRPDDRPSMMEATVTLELDAQQIEELAKVQDAGSGKLRLSLRPAGDNTTPGKDLMAKKDAKEAKEEKVPAPPPPPEPEVQALTPGTPPKPAEGPKEPETITKTITVFNGGSWVQRVYTLDAKGNVLSSKIEQMSEAPKSSDAKLEVKPPPADNKPERTDEKANNTGS